MNALSSRVIEHGIALLLAALALAVYANSLGNGFVWDDERVVVLDPAARAVTRLGSALLSPDETKPYYRPLMRLSFVLEWAIFGPDPRPFHAVSVAFHAFSVLLLYYFALSLFHAVFPAATAAALLAVHPVNAEVVNFVSGRSNVMAVAFTLAALLVFGRSCRTEGRVWPALSGVLFFFALASKEPVVAMIPLLALVLTLETRAVGRPVGVQDLTRLVPIGVAALVYLALRWLVLGGLVGGENVLQGLSGRALTALAILPRYVVLVVWPSRLTVFHPAPRAEELLSLWGVVPWVVLVAAVALAVRRPTGASVVGLLWFGLGLLPSLNLIPIPSAVVAERFLYLPGVGLWLLIGDLLSRLALAAGRPRLVAAGLALVVAVLSVRTVARNRDWQSDLTLFRSAVAADERSAVALFNLGVSLREAGDLQAATQRWHEALAIDPRYAESLTELGTAAAIEGRFPEAESFYARALAADPSLAMAHFNMARLLEKTGRESQARPHYEAFLANLSIQYEELAPQVRERLRALQEAPASTPGGQ